MSANAQRVPTPAEIRKFHYWLSLLLLCLLALGVVFHSARGDGSVIVGLTAILYPAMAVFFGVLMFRYRRSIRRPVWLAIVCPALSIAVMMSVALTQWPLRVSFSASRDRLDGLAAAIHAGQQVATPTRVGLFIVREADISRDGVAGLWIDDSSIGRRGFVQCRPERAPRNLWSITRLDDSWLFVEED